jgi:hypothetical protein
METYVFLTLASFVTCTTNFLLWMSYAWYDTYAMVISFINHAWYLVHMITFELFKVQNTTSVNMAEHVKAC